MTRWECLEQRATLPALPSKSLTKLLGRNFFEVSLSFAVVGMQEFFLDLKDEGGLRHRV